jgi:hypothetical protein
MTDDLTIPVSDDGAQALACLPVNPTYEQLKALEVEIAKLPPGDCPVTHHFATGVYCREMFIPAGTVLTGKIHVHDTLNILLEGEITVTTPEGMKRLKAPAVFVSPPGCKKAGYAHTDVRWLNVHGTKLTDLTAIEAKFIEPERMPALESQG